MDGKQNANSSNGASQAQAADPVPRVDPVPRIDKVPPVVVRDDDEETTDFAAVISTQAGTIAEQQRQINNLLAAVSKLTASGANYQQGERPQTLEQTESVHDSIPLLSELDFSMK